MPSNKNLSSEDEVLLETGGDVKPDTKRRRKNAYEDFEKYLESKTGLSVGDLLDDKNNETAREVFSKNLGLYFWSYQVKDSDGVDRSPRLGTALKVRSLIKSEVVQRHSIDFTDPVLFPLDDRRWKSFSERLGKEGLADTIHKEEIPADTIEALYQLFSDTYNALKARGTPAYKACLAKIPLAYHHRLHYLLQWAAQFILTMFEVRRGAENMGDLKKSDFVIMDDKTWNFRCIRKVISEQDKNHKLGTNRQETGIIPFMFITSTFNPGEIFELYLSFLPDAGTLPGKPGGFLFPKPRLPCKKFDVHLVENKTLFQPNQSVGRNLINGMLPSLCEVVEKPKCTNHQIRVTSIKALRRAGYDWDTISKITGHKNPQNLVKHYDLSLEAPDLAAISAAIGSGPGIVKGDSFAAPTLQPREDRSESDYISSGRRCTRKSLEAVSTMNDEDEEFADLSTMDSSSDEYKPSPNGSDTSSSSDSSHMKRSSNQNLKFVKQISPRNQVKGKNKPGVEDQVPRSAGNSMHTKQNRKLLDPQVKRCKAQEEELNESQWSEHEQASQVALFYQYQHPSPIDGQTPSPHTVQTTSDHHDQTSRCYDQTSQYLTSLPHSDQTSSHHPEQIPSHHPEQIPSRHPEQTSSRNLNQTSCFPEQTSSRHHHQTSRHPDKNILGNQEDSLQEFPQTSLHHAQHQTNTLQVSAPLGTQVRLQSAPYLAQATMVSTPFQQINNPFSTSLDLNSSQSMQSLQMAQVALQAQAMQAQLAQAMQAQALQAQSKFFLSLQAQLAAQADASSKYLGKRPVDMEIAFQGTTAEGTAQETTAVGTAAVGHTSQLTFTQRVETLISGSPEKY